MRAARAAWMLAIAAVCVGCGSAEDPSTSSSTASPTGSTGATASSTGSTGATASSTGSTGATASSTGSTGATASSTGSTGATASSTGSTGANLLSGLDETGVEVPDTDDPIPSGAIFMAPAPSGDDTHPGTQASPVATLAKAITKVPSGGTVVVRGGVYRDGSSTATSKRFTLQAFPHEQVWFDGTEVVTGWQAAGNGQWSIGWDTPDFCNGHYDDLPYTQQTSTGPCAFYDEYGDPANPAAADPQMVFVDGAYVHEVTTLAQATGANFFYDQSARKLYLGLDPTGHTVELTKRPMALRLEGGAGGNVIRGIGFRRYASNEYNAVATHAAVLANEPQVTFEDDVFTGNAGAGLSVANPQGGVVRHNVFAHNGANGLDSNGHEHSSGAVDGFDVENNLFNANNAERFGPGCGYSCSAAGIKFAHMDGFTLKNNLFENGVIAKGFWCDLACSQGVMVNNAFVNNGDTGLMYEVSDTGIIASNLIVGSGAYGLKVGSAHTQIYNNTLVNNAKQVLLYDDDRTLGVGGWTDVGPDTTDLAFVNNVLSGGDHGLSAWRTSATAPNTGPGTFFSALDFNAYFRPGGAPATLFDWREGSTTSYPSCASLQAAHGWEGHCVDLTSGADPFFVDAAIGDYRVRAGSAASGTGQALPADVAAALGVPAGQAVDRGALSWVGMP